MFKAVQFSAPRKSRILVVDDDSGIRNVCSALFSCSGYSVDTAEDGFAALLSIKYALPDLLVSDLNMPHMSGFELLSVVRRRFPQVLVIAMSGAYECAEEVPAGVIADAFYPKGRRSVTPLLTMAQNLLGTVAIRTPIHLCKSAPVWIPRNGKDASGRPFIVITCTECLRSFPMNVPEEVSAEILLTPCVFCANEVRYIIDFSRPVASPEKTMAVAASGRWTQRTQANTGSSSDIGTEKPTRSVGEKHDAV
jgi:CheY-like chemotaxis protein